MNLKKFEFRKPKDRPFFFTSFVSTIDGKIIVKDDKRYWPIGSKIDFEYFTFLRAHADCIVDAKNTALEFGKYTIKTIHSKKYLDFRHEVGQKGQPEFIVLTSNPDENLSFALKNDFDYKTTIMTTKKQSERDGFNTIHVENKSSKITPEDLINYLNLKNHKFVFVDGGPSLIAQLINENLLDEIHLTIAPKIFGSSLGKTLTMVEGMLFDPDKIPNFNLLSIDKIEDEVFLRYKKV